MNQTDVWIMALNKEREINLARHMAEGRIRRELAERPLSPERADHGGVLRLAWRVVDGVLQSRWTAPGPRRGDGAPRVAAADVLVEAACGR